MLTPLYDIQGNAFRITLEISLQLSEFFTSIKCFVGKVYEYYGDVLGRSSDYAVCDADIFVVIFNLILYNIQPPQDPHIEAGCQYITLLI